MRSTVTALLAALAFGCGGSQGSDMNSDIQRGPMPQGGSFAGIWFGNWGEMSISTQGSSVVGEFCQEDRNRYGRFEGTAQGNVMTVHWITYDVSMGGARRETDGSAIVQYRVEAAGEGESHLFEGTWGYGRANSGAGVWRATKSPGRSDRYLRGGYSMECPLREAGEAPPPMSDGEGGGDESGDEESSDEEEPSGDGSILDEI
jgi:hypothetical protein